MSTAVELENEVVTLVGLSNTSSRGPACKQFKSHPEAVEGKYGDPSFTDIINPIT
jgi:hypothetical protein